MLKLPESLYAYHIFVSSQPLQRHVEVFQVFAEALQVTFHQGIQWDSELLREEGTVWQIQYKLANIQQRHLSGCQYPSQNSRERQIFNHLMCLRKQLIAKHFPLLSACRTESLETSTAAPSTEVHALWMRRSSKIFMWSTIKVQHKHFGVTSLNEGCPGKKHDIPTISNSPHFSCNITSKNYFLIIIIIFFSKNVSTC